jgi:hypothetical protein
MHTKPKLTPRCPPQTLLAAEFVTMHVFLGPLNGAITAADEAVPRRPRARTEG